MKISTNFFLPSLEFFTLPQLVQLSYQDFYSSILGSLPDLLGLITSAFKKVPIVKVVQRVYDWTSWFSPYMTEYTHHTTARAFRFFRDSDNRVKMQYKTYSTDVDWQGCTLGAQTNCGLVALTSKPLDKPSEIGPKILEPKVSGVLHTIALFKDLFSSTAVKWWEDFSVKQTFYFPGTNPLYIVPVQAMAPPPPSPLMANQAHIRINQNEQLRLQGIYEAGQLILYQTANSWGVGQVVEISNGSLRILKFAYSASAGTHGLPTEGAKRSKLHVTVSFSQVIDNGFQLNKDGTLKLRQKNTLLKLNLH